MSKYMKSRISRSSASKSKVRHFRNEYKHQEPAHRNQAFSKESKAKVRDKPHEKDVAVSDSSTLSGRISMSECDATYSKQDQEDLKMNDENDTTTNPYHAQQPQQQQHQQHQHQHPQSGLTENIALSRNNGNVGSYMMNGDSTENDASSVTDVDHDGNAEDENKNNENNNNNENYYLYQFPLTDDDSIISDKEEEDEQAVPHNNNNNGSNHDLHGQQRKLIKIETGSKSCCSVPNEQQHAMRQPADRAFTPKFDVDINASFLLGHEKHSAPAECTKCSSYKSEINYLRGIAVTKLGMNKLMELEKELITSLSRVQNAINEKYKNEKLCIVCMAERKCIVYQPCGHFSTCFACSKQLEKCPICMQTICDKFRVYH